MMTSLSEAAKQIKTYTQKSKSRRKRPPIDEKLTEPTEAAVYFKASVNLQLNNPYKHGTYSLEDNYSNNSKSNMADVNTSTLTLLNKAPLNSTAMNYISCIREEALPKSKELGFEHESKLPSNASQQNKYVKMQDAKDNSNLVILNSVNTYVESLASTAKDQNTHLNNSESKEKLTYSIRSKDKLSNNNENIFNSNLPIKSNNDILINGDNSSKTKYFPINFEQSLSGRMSQRGFQSKRFNRRPVWWSEQLQHDAPSINQVHQESRSTPTSNKNPINLNVFDSGYFEVKDNPGYNSSDESLDEVLCRHDNRETGKLFVRDDSSPEQLSLSPLRSPLCNKRRTDVRTPSSNFISAGELERSKTTTATSSLSGKNSSIANLLELFSPMDTKPYVQGSLNIFNRNFTDSKQLDNFAHEFSTQKMVDKQIEKNSFSISPRASFLADGKLIADSNISQVDSTVFSQSTDLEAARMLLGGPRRLVKHLSSSKNSQDHVRQIISVKHFQDGLVRQDKQAGSTKSYFASLLDSRLRKSEKSDETKLLNEESITESIKFYLLNGKVKIVETILCERMVPSAQSSCVEEDADSVWMRRLVVEVTKSIEIDMMTSDERWDIYSHFQSAIDGQANVDKSVPKEGKLQAEEGLISAKQMSKLCARLEKLVQSEVQIKS